MVGVLGHRLRAAAILLALCLTAAACGSTANQRQVTSGGGDIAFEDTDGDDLAFGDDDLDLQFSDEDAAADAFGGLDDGEAAQLTSPQAGSSGGASPAGQSAPSSGSAAEPSPSGGTTAPAPTAAAEAPAAARNSGRGFTDTEIKVGFITISQEGTGQTGEMFGVDIADGGDGRRQVEAVVKYVNDRGGVAGRQVVPVIVERRTSSSDPDQMETICTRLTQDEQVFAVVTNFARDSQECYAQHKTLLLSNAVESELVTLRGLNPYVWVPGLPTMEAGYVAKLDGLAAQGYFDGDVKLGIVAYEDPRTRDTYERVVLPRLRQLGVEPDSGHYIEVMQPQSDADNAQWAQQIGNAQLRFNADGVTHVFFMAPGAGVPLIFMNQAETQLYRPRYGLSSYDSPGLLLQPAVPATQLRGALGGGFNMIADVDGQRGDPYPAEPAETECYEALQATGDSPPAARATSFQASYLCDGLFMLEKAAAGLNELSVERWGARAERLDRSFQATYSLPGGTRFAPGLRAGGQSYRLLRYNTSCLCFEYASDNRAIPRVN